MPCCYPHCRSASRRFVGAVVATIAIDVVRRPLIAVYTARCCAVPLQRYFLDAYLRPLIVVAALTAIALAIRHSLPLDGFAMLVVSAMALGAAWAALCWWVGFVDQDRRAFREILDRMLDKIGPASRGLGTVDTALSDSKRTAGGED